MLTQTLKGANIMAIAKGLRKNIRLFLALNTGINKIKTMPNVRLIFTDGTLTTMCVSGTQQEILAFFLGALLYNKKISNVEFITKYYS